MYKHILLPTDGSDAALHGVDAGIALAKVLGARVRGLVVVSPFSNLAYLGELVQATETTYMQHAAERAERYLQDITQRADKAGVTSETQYVFDSNPARTILDMATAHACDLIVMGTHGRRGMERMLLGSETHRVILESEIPVLVCH